MTAKHQTALQADITKMEPSGLTDEQRNQQWHEMSGEKGRAPVVVGGSSSGKSDQNNGKFGETDMKKAEGHYLSEKSHGRGRPEMDRLLHNHEKNSDTGDRS